MKKNQGFTLIELLTVIVILAVIALIATPLILNVIEKTRKSADIQSVRGILEAGEKYIFQEALDGITTKKYHIDLGQKNELSYKGKNPEKGILLIDQNENMSIIAKMGKYCIEKKFIDKNLKIIEKENCEIDDLEIIQFNNMIGLNKSGNACVTDNNIICSQEEIKEGIAVIINVNESENYIFNVINDYGDTLDLEINFNIGQKIAWMTNDDYLEASGTACVQKNGCNDYGPISLFKSLKQLTKNWSYISNQVGTMMYQNNRIDLSNYKARLITKEEMNKLGCIPIGADGSGKNSCPKWFGTAYWSMTAFPPSQWSDWQFAAITVSSRSENSAYVSNNNVSYRPIITVSKSMIQS